MLSGRYQIGEKIGTGAMGDVYLGKDVSTDRTVAIKILKSDVLVTDPKLLARFQREADILCRLHHPNIVKILDSLEYNNQHIIVMEYLAGGSLRDLLLSRGPLPADDFLGIALELADALARAHHLNVIHRDLKPANVLLDSDDTPRLSDFGLAGLLGEASLASQEVIMGTFPYMSPESFNGQSPDTRSDIWSMGVMMYELLAGVRPFRGETLSALIKTIATDPPSPDLQVLRPDIPDQLAALIGDMLQKDPSVRMDSMRRVATRLEDIQRKSYVSPSSINALLDVATSTVAVHNIPRSSTSLIGRQADMQSLLNQLSEPNCRMISIIGPGGSGKTRLALALAEAVIGDYQHGVFFVDLSPLQSAEHVASTIVEVLKIPAMSGDDFDEYGPGVDNTRNHLLDYVRHKKMLLVLDNCEHVLAAAPLVDEMLASAPQLKVIVTSRAVLHLDWEWVYDLQGLETPADITNAHLADYGAIALFSERARRTQRQFNLEDDLVSVVRICQILDGMPLGIEMATSWLRGYSCADLAAELEENLTDLFTRQHSSSERHFSLRVVFDHSWQLLTSTLQAVLCKLSVFEGAFRYEATRAVASADRIDLVELVDKSLLRVDSDGRYSLHALIREFAREYLVSDPEVESTTRHRHAQYFASLLSSCHPDLKGPKMREAATGISSVIDDIRAAWEWAIHQHKRDLIIEMSYPLYTYHLVTEQSKNKGVPWFESVLDAWKPFSGDEPLLYGYVLAFNGGLREDYHRHVATNTLRQSVDILRRENDQYVLPVALLHLGLCLRDHERNEAKQLLSESISLFEGLEDYFGIARAYDVLGMIAIDEPDLQIEHFQLGLINANKCGSPWLEILSMHNLGLAFRSQGDAAAGEKYYLDALKIARNLSLHSAQVSILSNLAHMYRYQGRLDASQHLLEEALTLARQSGARKWIARVLWEQSQCARYMGKFNVVEELMYERLEIHREIGDRFGEARALDGLAYVRFQQGRKKEAAHLEKQADMLARELMDQILIRTIGNNIGWRAILNKDYAEAKRRFLECDSFAHDAAGRETFYVNMGHACAGLNENLESRRYYLKGLALIRQNDYTPMMLEVIAGLARHVAAYGELEEAVAILALTLHHPATITDVKDAAEPLLAELEAELSGEVISAAVDRGKTLDLDKVIEELLIHPGIALPDEEMP